MNKFFPVFLYLICLYACESKKPLQEMTPIEQAKQKKEDLAKLSLDIGLPTRVGQSDYVIFPLSTNLMLSRDEEFSSSVYEKGKGFRPLWNLIFYNRKTKEQRLLLEKEEAIIINYTSGLIKKYEDEQIDTLNHFAKKWIFYEMIAKDYNQDKKLNLLDPTYFYMSDSIGNHLLHISPPNHHLLQWWLPWNDNYLIIRTLKDTNRNKLFEAKDDEESYFLIDLLNPKVHSEIIDSKFKSKLKTLYLERKTLAE